MMGFNILPSPHLLPRSWGFLERSIS